MSVRRLSEPSSPPTSQEASSKPSTISTPKIVAVEQPEHPGSCFHIIQDKSFRYHCNVAQSIYDGPTICAKDQTKATELIEVCRQRRLKKATYITIYALTFIGSYQLYIRRYLSWVFTLSDIILKACVPGIPPIVIEVNPSGKTEKVEINMHDNNLIMRELNHAGLWQLDYILMVLFMIGIGLEKFIARIQHLLMNLRLKRILQ
ncbi:uncharacterized protein OCT59_029386 [Rhizophagus irregularis]|nr:hypothetical protein OCT59_029386 [Rhizophagus irregularis]GBC40982.2 hypothetical protein GLOIN_2v1844828 [Rhizophagus irregularis DAOM 181602=DAOM 197198]